MPAGPDRLVCHGDSMMPWKEVGLSREIAWAFPARYFIFIGNPFIRTKLHSAHAQTWLWPIPALGDFFFLSPLAILHPYRTAQYVKWETPSYVMATESSQGCSWVIRGDPQSTRVAEQTLWRSWFSTTVPPFFSLKRWLGNKPVTGASFSRFNYDS